jgi:hypothetical protein
MFISLRTIISGFCCGYGIDLIISANLAQYIPLPALKPTVLNASLMCNMQCDRTGGIDLPILLFHMCLVADAVQSYSARESHITMMSSCTIPTHTCYQWDQTWTWFFWAHTQPPGAALTLLLLQCFQGGGGMWEITPVWHFSWGLILTTYVMRPCD